MKRRLNELINEKINFKQVEIELVSVLLHSLTYISCISLSDSLNLYFQIYIFLILTVLQSFWIYPHENHIFSILQVHCPWMWQKHANTHLKINLLVLHFLMHGFSQRLHFSTIKMHASMASCVLVIINSVECKLLLRYAHKAKAEKPEHRMV